MRRMRTVCVFALVMALAPWSAAQASVRIGLGLGIGIPLFGYAPAYYAPYPVYVPPPVVYAAPPVYYQPPPVCQAAPTYQPSYTPAPAPAPAPQAVATPAPERLAPLAVTPVSVSATEVDTALQQLAAGDDRGRAAAAVQLGRLHADRAVAPLMRALGQDPSPTVREAAARGLGLIAAPASLTALERAAGADDDRDVRHSASFAAEIIRSNLPR